MDEKLEKAIVAAYTNPKKPLSIPALVKKFHVGQGQVHRTLVKYGVTRSVSEGKRRDGWGVLNRTRPGTVTRVVTISKDFLVALGLDPDGEFEQRWEPEAKEGCLKLYIRKAEGSR
jgi:hypothetical protein